MKNIKARWPHTKFIRQKQRPCQRPMKILNLNENIENFHSFTSSGNDNLAIQYVIYCVYYKIIKIYNVNVFLRFRTQIFIVRACMAMCAFILSLVMMNQHLQKFYACISMSISYEYFFFLHIQSEELVQEKMSN